MGATLGPKGRREALHAFLAALGAHSVKGAKYEELRNAAVAAFV